MGYPYPSFCLRAFVWAFWGDCGFRAFPVPGFSEFLSGDLTYVAIIRTPYLLTVGPYYGNLN